MAATQLKKQTECLLCGKRIPSWKDGYCHFCREGMTDAMREKLKLGIDQYVYAISVDSDDSALVKFGYSRCVEWRLAQLQTGSPVRLVVVAKCRGLRHHEHSIHLHLAGDRAYGEWFRRSTRANAVIEAIQKDSIIGYLADAGPRGRYIKHLRQQNLRV